MKQQELLMRKLEELRTEHRDLDDLIKQVISGGRYDQLQIQRLKKRKLVLKDQIARVESDPLGSGRPDRI